MSGLAIQLTRNPLFSGNPSPFLLALVTYIVCLFVSDVVHWSKKSRGPVHTIELEDKFVLHLQTKRQLEESLSGEIVKLEDLTF